MTLPPLELLDNAHIQNPCTRVQFAADATARRLADRLRARPNTPLLEKPLEGPVYLRSAPDHKLPDMVAALNGQIDIDLDGRVTSPGRPAHELRNGPRRAGHQVHPEPDGGNKGLLVNSANLCQCPQKASLKMGGQNGALLSDNVKIATPCGSKGKEQRRQHLRRPLEAGKGH